MRKVGSRGEGKRTLGSAGQLERAQTPDLTKDVGFHDALQLARLRIRSEELETSSAPGHADLLLLGSAEVAYAAGGDGRRREERVVVEIDHGGERDEGREGGRRKGEGGMCRSLDELVEWL